MVFRASHYPDGFATAVGFHYASLGSTLPVAIGAKLAAPDRLVISYGGDGGFYYDCSDLSLLGQHGLKVIVIVNNNGGLFGVRRGRGSIPGLGESSWMDLPGADFVAVANGFGVQAERVEKIEQLVPAIQRAVVAPGPYLLDVQTAASSVTMLMAGMSAANAAKPS